MISESIFSHEGVIHRLGLTRNMLYSYIVSHVLSRVVYARGSNISSEREECRQK